MIPFRKLGRSTGNDPHCLYHPGKSMGRLDVGYYLSDPTSCTPPPLPAGKKSDSATAARTTHFLVRVQPLDLQVLLKYSAALCLSMPLPQPLLRVPREPIAMRPLWSLSQPHDVPSRRR